MTFPIGTHRDIAAKYTLFASLTNTQGQQISGTWADIRTMITDAPKYPTKAAQPLLKLATFAGGNRSNALEAVHGVEIDYDAGDMPMAEAARLIQQAGILAMLYPSYTATPTVHKWRILAPLSAPVAPGDRAAWVAALDGVIGNIAARESYTPKQCYFFGRNPAAEWYVISTDGACIDALPAMQQTATAYTDNLQAEQSAREAAALQAAQARIQQRDQRAGRALVGGQLSVIHAFNRAYSVPAILAKHGYKPDRKGTSYLAPGSTSGVHGVRLLDNGNKCYSHHSNDPLADGKAHDAFDVFCILEHGGDVIRATSAGGLMLYLNGWQTITHYNRDIFRHHQQRAAAATRAATAGGAA